MYNEGDFNFSVIIHFFKKKSLANKLKCEIAKAYGYQFYHAPYFFLSCSMHFIIKDQILGANGEEASF